ncbi:MAG: hypothetical protein V4486_02970 [Patescibacteria group bacterium]
MIRLFLVVLAFIGFVVAPVAAQKAPRSVPRYEVYASVYDPMPVAIPDSLPPEVLKESKIVYPYEVIVEGGLYDDFLLEVVVSYTGKILAINPIGSGYLSSPFLLRAAKEGLGRWKFKPFSNNMNCSDCPYQGYTRSLRVHVEFIMNR